MNNNNDKKKVDQKEADPQYILSLLRQYNNQIN